MTPSRAALGTLALAGALSPPKTVQRRGRVAVVVAWFAATFALVVASPAIAAGLPAAYAPRVVVPTGGPDKAEFDLSAVVAEARRDGKRLYVYLGASDCPYCRRYEAFLADKAAELLPHFKPWIVVDLRSSLAVTSRQLFIRVDDKSLGYADFQRSIGDERARRLVYPSVWLFDPRLKPLMPMPAGTGTFETVTEQIDILRLVQ